MNETQLNTLKKCREVAGYTQKQVEQELGMRNLMMRDYEVGRLKLPVSIALKLSDLYGVSLDSLVGAKGQISRAYQSKVLVNFNSLFLGNGFSIMFLDPIIRAYLEDHEEDCFNYSLFELLTIKNSPKQRKEIIIEISKMLFSLASSDGRVLPEESECIKYLLAEFEILNKYKDISSTAGELYYPVVTPKGLDRVELRHFTIWMLFFFAYTDGNLGHEEISYIEKCSEYLRVNKSNFLFIKRKFVKEQI